MGTVSDRKPAQAATVGPAITAGSTQTQAGATVLVKDINEVTVSGTNGDGVQLPPASKGLRVTIINADAAQTIQVWPASGDDIDGGATNAVDSSTIGSGDTRDYEAINSSSWYGVGAAATGDALTSNPLSQFASTTSAQLAGVISNETGSGALTFATSPTFVTPALGTPASGVMTNVSGTAASLTAGKATTLATARTIGGVSFDGSGNIAPNIVTDTTPQLGGDLSANGNQIQWSKGADVASATALVLLTDGNYFDVTGTTTITSFNTTAVGTVIKLHFDGALILTHHATDLVLPGAANITTAAGDEAEFVEHASGDYRCTFYTKADGTSVVSASSAVGVHEVFMNTLNGNGSTNTKINRYTNAMINTGTAITYADSAANGASFTINEDGVYSMTMSGESGGSNPFGISLNSSQLTTDIQSITAVDRISMEEGAGSGLVGSHSVTMPLSENDVIRSHDNGNMSSTIYSTFHISKVSS